MEHFNLPDYLRPNQLPIVKGIQYQLTGNKSHPDNRIRLELLGKNFWSDTNNYMFMYRNGDRLPIAWLGYVRHSNSGVVIIKHIQGRKNTSNMPISWPEKILTAFICALDTSQIHTLYVQPARLNRWWKNRDAILRGRLRTYYDRIPNKLGFVTVPKSAVKAYLKNKNDGQKPYHGLRLENWRRRC